MEKRKVKKSGIPKFADEQDEAKWWASAEGRAFLRGEGRLDSCAGSTAVQRMTGSWPLRDRRDGVPRLHADKRDHLVGVQDGDERGHAELIRHGGELGQDR